MTRSKIIRRCVGWAMGVIFVLSLVVWNVTRETLPREVRIATAAHGGLYHKFAEALAPHIEQRTGRTVTLLETEGTADNVHRLLDRKADLAILQSGAMFLNGVVALAPLYHDVVFIVARKDRGIGTFRDLAGGKVAIGLPGSGMRSSAVALLDHYDIGVGSPHHTDQYFLDLLDDESLDAAIITTGFMNPDLERLLATGDFTIVPVHEAEAFCLRNPSFEPMSIPRGLYGHGPALPAEPVATVATTAVLAASEHTSSVLITETLDALYTTDVRCCVPTPMTRGQAAVWHKMPMHPVAHDYFNPYGGIDTLASFMESLAAGKELLFALAAGLYLLWDRYRRIKERERTGEIKVMKERLDAFLSDTVRIERAQMETSEADKLKAYLDEITRIKLDALDELTHEDLRGDRMFHIFLAQCANVINKIQAKISLTSAATR